jgi:hypothetical protein
VEHWTCTRERGQGGAKLSAEFSVNKHRKGSKGWEQAGNKPSPQSRAGNESQSWSPEPESSIQNRTTPQNWKKKKKTSCNLAQAVEGVGGTLDLPQKKGAGQRTKLSVLSCHSDEQTQWWAISKAGQVVDRTADLLNQRAAFKIEHPHLTVGEADQTAAAER